MAWPIKKIGEITTDIKSGFACGKQNEIASGVVHFRTHNIDTEGNLNFEKTTLIPMKLVDKNAFGLEPGDILFNNTNSTELVGKTALVKEKLPYAFSNHITRIRVNQNSVLPEWLAYTLISLWQSKYFEKICTRWVGQSGINQTNLKNIQISLPPIVEQKKNIAKLERLLRKVTEAKKLCKQTQPSGDLLFSAELHKIFEEGKNKGWEEKEIGKICELNPSKNKIKNKGDGLHVSFVPMSAIDENAQEITILQERQLGDVKKGYTYFENGDVLFAKITPCMENGKVVIAKNLKNGIGFGTTEFHVIRPNSNVLPEWIYSIVRQPFFRELARAKMTGSAGQKRVPIQFLEKFRIPLPPLSEQKKIVAHLDKISQKIGYLQKYQTETVENFNRLEQSIFNKAFTGQLIVEPVRAQVKRTWKEWFAIKQGVGSVLEKLAQTAYERGEMVIAKYMFFLQEIYKVPFGLHFVEHQFGPYDPDIKVAIKGSIFKDRYFTVKGSEDKQVYGLGSNSFKLFQYDSHILTKSRDSLSELMQYTANAKSSDIERLASVCKLIQDYHTVDEQKIQNKMAEWKPGKFTEEQIKRSLEFIRSKNWNKALLGGN